MRNSEVVRPLEVIGEEVGREDAEVTHVVVERVEQRKEVSDALATVVVVAHQRKCFVL